MFWPQVNLQQHEGSSGREAPLVTARNWICGQGCGKGKEGRVGLGEQDQGPSLQRKLEIPDYEFGPSSMAKCRWGW